jgi:hypothetical protein
LPAGIVPLRFMLLQRIIRHKRTFLDGQPFESNDRTFSLYSSDFQPRRAVSRMPATRFALDQAWDWSPTLPWSSRRWT